MSSLMYYLRIGAYFVITALVFFLIQNIALFLKIDFIIRECFSWICIVCTFCGFLLPIPFVKSGRHKDYSINAIYIVAYCSIIGDIIGLSILGLTTNKYILLIVCFAIISYQFATRHATVEKRSTAHFGQIRDCEAPTKNRKNSKNKEMEFADKIKRELVLGHTSDMLQIFILIAFYIHTQHPIWIFGAIILAFSYLLSVKIHHIPYLDKPITYGLSLLLLFSMTIIVWPILGSIGVLSNWVGRFYNFFIISGVLSEAIMYSIQAYILSNNEKNNSTTKEEINVFTVVILKYKKMEPIKKIHIVTILISGLFGVIFYPGKLNVHTSYMLFGKPTLMEMIHYSLFIIFFSSIVNMLYSGIILSLRRKKKTT